MTKLTLNNAIQNTTVLENDFIDYHMVNANGEYIKVYLLLLRLSGDPSQTPSIEVLADRLDMTERDVIRALNYWKKEGVLDYETQTIPSRSNNIKTFRSQKDRTELKELIFVAQTYLGKPLTQGDLELVNFFIDDLDMTTDLIEYLIEYCVDNGHKSMHYIKKVAMNWHEEGITTVEAAKNSTLAYNRNCYSVLNAFGIKGRAPAESEMRYIRKWNEEYLFSLDMIVEACNRTVLATHQPSFEYADSILKSWLSKGAHTLSDVKAIDAIRSKNAKKKAEASQTTTGRTQFNNFSERSYDLSELERQLIQQ